MYMYNKTCRDSSIRDCRSITIYWPAEDSACNNLIKYWYVLVLYYLPRAVYQSLYCTIRSLLYLFLNPSLPLSLVDYSIYILDYGLFPHDCTQGRVS